MKNLTLLLLTLLSFTACKQKQRTRELLPPAVIATIEPIEPVGPLPNANQLAWQELEYYGFVHFNMNTFAHWRGAHGDESPSLFNPSELDTDQWARVMKDAGMKGIIITAKHHAGFSIYPTAYSEHSIKKSPWKDGKGDVIKELSESCKKYGLKLGIYLSPWDQNHADYGKPEYITFFRNQLTELLTNYGDIFEVWFDGYNGADGYYGGANETRVIDRKTYYDWAGTAKLIRELQPKAVIFSDAGPDVRWVGNETGYAHNDSWSTIFRDSVYGGMLDFDRFSKGQEDGTHWVPTETDVSIRPCWFCHKDINGDGKSLEELVDIYFNSVGKNSNLLLNVPVDIRGLIHENDEEGLMKLAAFIKELYKKDFAQEAVASVSQARWGYPSKHLNDLKKDTYWAPPKGQIESRIKLDWTSPVKVNTFMIQEYIALGQRIKSYQFEVKTENGWETVENGETIGNKRMIRFETKLVEAMRFTIRDAKASPVISNIGVYFAPDISED